MSTPIDTVVIRHPREMLSKCSLTPVQDRPDTIDWLKFYTARQDFRFDANGYTELAVDAPPLSEADRGRPFLLLDATWRLLPKVKTKVFGTTVRRSIPPYWVTAYPRVSKTMPDPVGGLASIEALFVAQAMLGHCMPTLLDGYYWKMQFLELNAAHVQLD
jgi:pre-rRNA-processing protein TSR3